MQSDRLANSVALSCVIALVVALLSQAICNSLQ